MPSKIERLQSDKKTSPAASLTVYGDNVAGGHLIGHTRLAAFPFPFPILILYQNFVTL